MAPHSSRHVSRVLSRAPIRMLYSRGWKGRFIQVQVSGIQVWDQKVVQPGLAKEMGELLGKLMAMTWSIFRFKGKTRCHCLLVM